MNPTQSKINRGPLPTSKADALKELELMKGAMIREEENLFKQKEEITSIFQNASEKEKPEILDLAKRGKFGEAELAELGLKIDAAPVAPEASVEQEADIEEILDNLLARKKETAEMKIKRDNLATLSKFEEKKELEKVSPATSDLTDLLGKENVENSVNALEKEKVDNPALKDVESTSKALKEYMLEYVNTGKDLSKHDAWFTLIDRSGLKGKGGYIGDNVAKAYHEAKATGSNPELVKAVEDILEKERGTPGDSESGPANAPEAEGLKIEPEEKPGDYAEVLRLVEYQLENPDVATTATTERFLNKYKNLVEEIKELREEKINKINGGYQNYKWKEEKVYDTLEDFGKWVRVQKGSYFEGTEEERLFNLESSIRDFLYFKKFYDLEDLEYSKIEDYLSNKKKIANLTGAEEIFDRIRNAGLEKYRLWKEENYPIIKKLEEEYNEKYKELQAEYNTKLEALGIKLEKTSYDKLGSNDDKEEFIKRVSRFNREMFKTQGEFIEAFENRRSQFKKIIDKGGDIKKAVLTEYGYIPAYFEDNKDKPEEIDKEYANVLKEYGLDIE